MHPACLAGTTLIFDSAEHAVGEAANFILTESKRSSRFAFSLSGGSTPETLYARMATMAFPWDDIHFFWGDERWVPLDHPRSNFRMVSEVLLKPAGIRPAQVKAVPTGRPSPEESASAYEQTVRSFFAAPPAEIPVFDLILLGLGEDGHTASLFPGDAAQEESARLICGARLRSEEPRITFTYRLIRKARNILFLVTGRKKNRILREFCHPGKRTHKYPAERIQPSGGRLFWFLDREAAEGL